MVRMKWDCKLSTAPPPPQQLTPSVVKPEGGSVASMKPGQKSCVRSSGIITLLARGPRDKARLRRGHRNYLSRRGHQCSETTLTGESRFHISPPRGFEPGFLVMVSKRVVHWSSETWWEWSEIASSPQITLLAHSKLVTQPLWVDWICASMYVRSPEKKCFEPSPDQWPERVVAGGYRSS